jgi:hypothetical protein
MNNKRERKKIMSTLYYACYNGDMKLVQQIQNRKGKKNWEEALEGACQGGQLEMVNYAIKCGARGFNKGLEIACEIGHMEILHLMMEKGANTFDQGLKQACANQHVEAAQTMLHRGAGRVNDALKAACLVGNEALVQLMIQHRANNWNSGFESACRGGHVNIMKMMKDKGASIYIPSTINDFHVDVLEYIIPFIPHHNMPRNYISENTVIRMLNAGKSLTTVKIYSDIKHVIQNRTLLIRVITNIMNFIFCADVISVLALYIAYPCSKQVGTDK